MSSPYWTMRPGPEREAAKRRHAQESVDYDLLAPAGRTPKGTTIYKCPNTGRTFLRADNRKSIFHEFTNAAELRAAEIEIKTKLPPRPPFIQVAEDDGHLILIGATGRRWMVRSTDNGDSVASYLTGREELYNEFRVKRNANRPQMD